MSRLAAIFVTLTLLLCSRAALAVEEKCSGPDECCPDKQINHLDHTVTVKAGVVMLGIANVSEKAGTWDGDFYLYESWPATPGFTPRTEIANEVARASTTFDDTELRKETCVRSRRIHATLRSELNLRLFPFDTQSLTLKLSDNQFDSTQLLYADTPQIAGIDDSVRGMVSGWHITREAAYAHVVTPFKWEEGAPSYDNATFSFTVARHVTFHLTRYFLPLLLILAVAFGAFWIDPEDLGSQMQIGVTCLLAAIALQFAEGGTLPEVSYLTLADRMYAVCYVGIAVAVLESIVVNAVARRGDKEKARRIDRVCRVAFPALVLVGLTVSTVRALGM
jgi:hypothetical protein